MKVNWTIIIKAIFVAALPLLGSASYEIVTMKSQIATAEKAIKSNQDDLRREIAASNTVLRKEINTREELREEIGSIRGELREEIGSVREEINMRGELRDLRGNLIKHYKNHAKHGKGE